MEGNDSESRSARGEVELAGEADASAAVSAIGGLSVRRRLARGGTA